MGLVTVNAVRTGASMEPFGISVDCGLVGKIFFWRRFCADAMAIRIRDFLNTERIESVGDGVVYDLLLGLPNVEELNPFKMAFCPRNERFGGETVVRNP